MIIDKAKYTERDMAISATKMNIIGILLFFSLLLSFGYLYKLFWGESLVYLSSIWILLAVLIWVVIHELIHGITASKYAEKGWKSISFGVMWKYLAAYCHCNEPLTVKQYRIVALMPSIIALIAIGFGLAINNQMLYGSSVIILGGGVGDFMVVYHLRKEKSDTLIYDYPDKIGAAILEPISDYPDKIGAAVLESISEDPDNE